MIYNCCGTYSILAIVTLSVAYRVETIIINQCNRAPNYVKKIYQGGQTASKISHLASENVKEFEV